MNIFESILLGLIQGLSEFLPISSSGHLALLQYFFGIEGESVLIFAVLLHFGTLIAVLIVYRKDIWELIIELGRAIKDIFTGKGLNVNANENRRLGYMIIVATIPVVIIGLLFNDFFKEAYTNILMIGICLIITGTFLWIAERQASGYKGIREMRFRDAVFVGVLQCIAMLPGISRSGATIVGGLFAGLNRELAVKFAFLISIPSVIGAVILETPAAIEQGLAGELLIPVIIGVVIAGISGFIAIKTMIKIVSNKKLFYFSFYTWIVGIAIVTYLIVNN